MSTTPSAVAVLGNTSFDSSLAKCIALSILLWRDATPGCKFPPMKELVAIEMTRLLGDPKLMRAIPGLPAALHTSGLDAELCKSPWEVDIKQLLHRFKKAVPPESLQMVQAYMEDQGHRDVVLDMIQYRQRVQTNSKEYIAQLTRKVCDVLGLEIDYGPAVAENYDRVYQEIIKV